MEAGELLRAADEARHRLAEMEQEQFALPELPELKGWETHRSRLAARFLGAPLVLTSEDIDALVRALFTLENMYLDERHERRRFENLQKIDRISCLYYKELAEMPLPEKVAEAN